MTVEIDSSVTSKESVSSQQEFDLLVNVLTAYSRHSVVLRKKDILESKFVENSSPVVKELLRQVFISSINKSSQAQCVIKNRTTESLKREFDVKEAIVYFNSPLEILLENCDNDSRLIFAIFKYFAPRFNISDKLEKKWIKFSGNGGCSSISNVIRSDLRSNGSKPKMLRYYIILDSDKKYKSQNVTKYNKLNDLLSQNNLKFHVWEKRCAENYLPMEAFELFRNSQTSDWINAFLYLSDEQKDYIDISRGYYADAGNSANEEVPDRMLLNTEECDFIKDVSEANFKILWNGLKIPNFKNKFLEAFESSYVYKKTLEDRIRHQSNSREFYDVVSEIEGLL